jgi:hypothetical protein
VSPDLSKKADYQYSNRDEGTGYRQAIKDLIQEHEKSKTDNKNSQARSIGYIVALAIAIISGFIITKYF